MKKRFKEMIVKSAFAALTMCMAALSLPAMAIPVMASVPDPEIDKLWVGSSGEVTSEGEISDTGAEGEATVSVENGSIVLTLKDFDWTGMGHGLGFYSGIDYTGDAPLEIRLEGDNRILQTNGEGNIAGINCNSDLEITGDGKLEVKSQITSEIYGATGIYADGDLYIKGGDITVEGKGEGIYTGGDITVAGGHVWALGSVNGMYVHGNITLLGGMTEASGKVYGLYSKIKKICLKGGSLRLSGSEAGNGQVIIAEGLTYSDGMDTYTENGAFNVISGRLLHITGWDSLKKVMSGGITTDPVEIILEEDFTCAELSDSNYLYVGGGVKRTLDLNGYKVDRNCTKLIYAGCVIMVSGGDLTINDSSATDDNPAGYGVITGGKNDYIGGSVDSGSGGGVYVLQGRLTMNGGNITGNIAEDGGGGIAISASSFVMNQGTISGNSAKTGGGLCSSNANSDITINDGVIEGNTADSGGGVYMGGNSNNFIIKGGSITGNNATGSYEYIAGGVYFSVGKPYLCGISGNARITGNVRYEKKNENGSYEGGIKSNLLFNNDDNVVTVTGKLEKNAEIGVTRINVYDDGEAIKIFADKGDVAQEGEYKLTEQDAAGFVSDMEDFAVKLTEAGKIVLCPSVETASVSGVSDNGYIYNGSAITPEITVMKGDNELIRGEDYTLAYADNLDAGEASLTINGIGDYGGKKVLTYKILKADISSNAIIPPVAKIGLEYDGGLKELVTPGTVSGNIGTIYYALTGSSEEAPAFDADTASPDKKWSTSVPSAAEAGEYKVWYKAAGDKNHNDTDAAYVAVKISERKSQDSSSNGSQSGTDEPSGDEGNGSSSSASGEKGSSSSSAMDEKGSSSSSAMDEKGSSSSSAMDEKESSSSSAADEKESGSSSVADEKGSGSSSAADEKGSGSSSVADGKEGSSSSAGEDKADSSSSATPVPSQGDDGHKDSSSSSVKAVSESTAPVSITIGGQPSQVSVTMDYTQETVYSGQALTPEDVGLTTDISDLRALAENALNSIPGAASLVTPEAVADLFTVSYKTKGKGDTGETTFTAKIKFDKKMAKNLGMSKEDIKALSKALKELNKSLKKNPAKVKIAKASLTDCFDSMEASFDQKGKLRIKSVTVKFSDNTVTLKKKDYKVLSSDPVTKTVTIEGQKNYEGTVTYTLK